MKYFSMFLLSLSVSTMSACDEDGDGKYFETTISCWSDKDDLSYLMEQLDELDIAYDFDEESGCVEYSSEGDPAIEYSRPRQVVDLRDMYPENFAPGRSASWGDRNPDLVKILEENGIGHDSYLVNDTEFISWPLDNVVEVEELLEYSEFLKQNNKETREAYPEFNSPKN